MDIQIRIVQPAELLLGREEAVKRVEEKRRGTARAVLTPRLHVGGSESGVAGGGESGCAAHGPALNLDGGWRSGPRPVAIGQFLSLFSQLSPPRRLSLRLSIPLSPHTPPKAALSTPNTLLYHHFPSLSSHMGRPLFSASRQPAVRVEPEPQHPTVEKWTYWNAFDPDSDEFFDNDDAVYEAFIDPANRIQLPTDPTDAPAEPIDVSSSSEASSSGRGTPTTVVDDIDHQADRMMTVTMQDLQSRTRIMRALDLPLPRNSTLDAAIDAGRGLPTAERVTYLRSLLDRTDPERERAEEPRALEAEARPALREREPTYLDWPQEDSRPTTPEPTEGPRASMPALATPVRPSTPPAQVARATPLFVSPSPPPSVTPRLYSWATISAPGLAVPTSPLTNRSARMSVAHIVRPSFVPVHRAT